MVQIINRYWKQVFYTSIFALLLWAGAKICRIDLFLFLKGLPRVIEILSYMFPPAWESFPELLQPALETLEIAFVGTVFGAILSFLLALIAARNINSISILRQIVRTLLSLERALPDLIVVLFFVAIVGLGAFPGVMALVASSIGMLGKLFADAIEEVDPKPLESLAALGATKWQLIRFAVIPQVLPSFVANTLYRFEVNIRMSIFLGVVGAGGIGYNLVTSLRLLKYQEAMSVIIIILTLVTLGEKSAEKLRTFLIGQEILK